ncbi:hypothetical protein F3087_43225 [Nocardia colli]|uniref:Uncharacterized protein n=1 Tax=Nocardia colli TaxID=2545717 RepID=A0A5N0DRY4_9NOCA|nr:hypothetical protein [Nocardia colli]KAA8879837.1 hypothetical protein F3087_43225 [Nocardia colli]
MQDESHGRRELVAAMFSSEFVEGGIDPAVLRRVHAGDHAEWLTALDRSGIFGKETLADLTARWHDNPRDLLDTLLTEADDVTKRRCLTAWAGLDRGTSEASAAQIS